MKLLKKRPIAILVCIAVIVLSTLYSAHRSLSARVRELNDSFYTGVYDKAQGVKRRSVSSQLDRRCDAVNGLVSIGEKYSSGLDPDILPRVFNTRYSLIFSNDIGEKYALNKELDAQFGELCSALEALGLSEREITALGEYKASFRGAQTVINASGYNEAVRAFERNTLGAFPANILRELAFVPTPVLFE